MSDSTFDVAVVGGGPAGLSAALNLARSRHRVLVIDAGRPRNAATLASHGFLTRDGIPPSELRSLGRAELATYPGVTTLERASVASVATIGDGFALDLVSRTPGAPTRVEASRLLVATGLREILPAIPSVRAYYGMSMYSCAACDGWELRDRRLAVIGETTDIADRAILVARWSDDVTVFTNGAPVVDAADEQRLRSRAISLVRVPIDDLEGQKGAVSAVRLVDGRRVPVDGGFIRPVWEPAHGFLDGLDLETDAEGHLIIDRSGRTSMVGIYAAGDVATPGPQQLIVAAGAGARVAAVLTHDVLGLATSH